MQVIRVVIADHSWMIRSGMRALLEATGNIQVVGETGDRNKIFGLVRRTDPDILILDVDLADREEPINFVEIREDRPGMKVLATGSTESSILARLWLEQGASGYLLKSDAPEQLVEAVYELAAGKTSWVSDNVHSLNASHL